MDKNLSLLYEFHHKSLKKGNFSIWERERGLIFSQWIGKGKSILDLGCRDGTLTRYFTNGYFVSGVDID
jgi:2-polyprenyl-3-methyl-5-hydroxy-6-metoxy-1,4-benzoquinol methylase